MIVVADLHQLMKRDKDLYVVDGTKVVERAGMKVEQSYVDTVNGASTVNGKLFIVDKEATEAWRKENAANVEAKKLKAEKAKLGLTETAEALIEKSKTGEKPKKTRRTKAQIEADNKAEE